MARTICYEPSRALAEFRLLPRLTTPESTADKVSLRTRLLESRAGRTVRVEVPLLASAMQAVSGPELAVALGELGGVACLFASQSVASEAEMVRRVKGHELPAAALPRATVDAKGRLLAVAAINTHDFEERVAALVAAGVDALVIDSSDGHSCFQQQTLQWLARHHPELPAIAGNVVTAEGFDYLAEAGAAAVKVGMGGGTICITQEQKGTGRGLATALIEVCAARERRFEQTGHSVPVVADGGVVTAKDAVIALAIGADTVMMGRYFARMEESAGEKVVDGNRTRKAYWGEGSPRAREWKQARYGQATFAEGVEGFVDYAGRLADNLPETLAMIRSSMSSCGVASVEELHREAVLEVVSALSIREGQVHDIELPRP